jgi:hypothetical protein
MPQREYDKHHTEAMSKGGNSKQFLLQVPIQGRSHTREIWGRANPDYNPEYSNSVSAGAYSSIFTTPVVFMRDAGI